MSWEIRQGDALELLRNVADESVQCVVTSPPYWGLRDYGVEGQIGLESSLDVYVEKLVEVFREVDVGMPSGNRTRHTADNSRGRPGDHFGTAVPWRPDGRGRNKRSVWTITTKPFPEAHFATFPPDLVEPCVLAGTPPAACAECAAPLRRIVSSRRLLDGEHEQNGAWVDPASALERGRGPGPEGIGHWRTATERVTDGWEPTCDHGSPGGASLVLDPFAGAGTTGLVALRHGRRFLGLELNPDFVDLARQRICDDAPLINGAAETAA